MASAAPANGPGTMRLVIAAPSEGTALIEISRVDAAAPMRTVVHRPQDEDIRDVELAPGTYRIMPRAMTAADQRYVAKSDPLQVRVQTGRVRESNVEYRWSKGVQNLRATDVTATSIALDWDAELGDDTTVWRTEGNDPPARPGDGTGITLDGSSLVDTGLAPGTTQFWPCLSPPPWRVGISGKSPRCLTTAARCG